MAGSRQPTIVERISGSIRESWLLRYAIATLLVGLATFLTEAVRPMHARPFVLFLAANMLTATFAGRGPGLLGIGLSCASVSCFFVNRNGWVLSSDEVVQLLCYALVAVTINSVFADRMKMLQKLRTSEKGLEERVQRRTAELSKINDQLSDEMARSREQADVIEERSRLAEFGRDVSVALTYGGPMRQMLQACCGAMVEHLSGALARIWTLNEAENVMELQASAGLYTHINGAHGVIPVGKYKIGMIAQEKKPHLTNSVIGDPRVPNQPWAKEQGLVSFAGYPLLLDDQLVGVMAMFSRAPLSDVTLKGMESVANSIAVGIRRKKTEDEIRRFAAIVESSGDAIIGKTLDGTITDWNYGAQRMYGYRSSEIIGRSITLLVPDDRMDELTSVMDWIKRGEQVPSLETVRRRKDGSLVQVDLTVSPIKDDQAAVIGAASIAHDITSRKLAERRRSIRLRVIEILASADDVPEAVRKILKAICESLQYDIGAFWKLDHTAHVLRCLDFHQQDSMQVSMFEIESRRTNFQLGVGLPGRVWTTGKSAWMSEILQDDNFPRKPSATLLGLHSAFAFPISVGSKFLGVIEFFSKVNRQPDPDILETMATIGVQIGHFIERKGAESAVRQSEERYRSITEAASDAMIGADSSGNIISWNQGALTIFGYAEEEILGQSLSFLIPQRYRQAHEQGLERVRRTGVSRLTGKAIELHGQRKDGSEFPAEISVATWSVGEQQYFSGIVRDITERKRLEAQYQQAQKMEITGQLAGGIAHDFNNLLTIILGYADLLDNASELDDVNRDILSEITIAAQRAAKLTRQLLAFSRRQVLQPAVLNLNDVVTDTAKMLRRLIGEDVELTTNLATDLWSVKVDGGQVEQVLGNLAINARDAMPQGGKLSIETANVMFDENCQQAHPFLIPGRYAMLSVADTGCGMDEATKARIFEPFFTTKEVGKGTGLGLAMVYGIVKQSDGYIEVESQPGQGTTFHIYFPQAECMQPGASSATRESNSQRASATETVLVVEDDDKVRKLACGVLRSEGYQVLEARSGEEALQTYEQHKNRIPLVVSDVVMPQMSGRQLSEQLRAIQPDLKVLFMSGYTDDAVVRHGVSEAEANFLQKPFTPAALAQKVRDVLDGCI